MRKLKHKGVAKKRGIAIVFLGASTGGRGVGQHLMRTWPARY